MAKIAAQLSIVAATIPSLLFDALGFAGAGCIGYGAWLIYEPAGFIVGGILALAASVLLGSRYGAA